MCIYPQGHGLESPLVELQWPEKRRTLIYLESLGYPCGAGAGAGLAVHPNCDLIRKKSGDTDTGK